MFPRRRRISPRHSRHSIRRQGSSLFGLVTVKRGDVLLLDMAMTEQHFPVHSRLVYSSHLVHADGGLHRISYPVSRNKRNELLCCT